MGSFRANKAYISSYLGGMVRMEHSVISIDDYRLTMTSLNS